MSSIGNGKCGTEILIPAQWTNELDLKSNKKPSQRDNKVALCNLPICDDGFTYVKRFNYNFNSKGTRRMGVEQCKKIREMTFGFS